MKVQPSQFDLNKMEQGDMVYIMHRPYLYKLYRDLFQSDKNKLKVRKNWNTDDYTEQYQEDCILFFDYELKCQRTLDSEIYYTMNKNGNSVKHNFKSVNITLNNIQFQFLDGSSLTVPLDNIKPAINSIEEQYVNIEKEKIIKDNVKYLKYTGEFFKNQVKKYNIKQWVVSYCMICGKSVVFKFYKDKIKVINNCECGNNILHKSELTYNEFALWYASTTEGATKKKFNEFWVRE